VVTNWDGLDAKAFAGIYNSNWVCSVVEVRASAHSAVAHVPLCVINYLCTYDLYSPKHNVLDACISITRGSGRGWALEFSNFLGPVKWHRAKRRAPFGAQKTLRPIYQA
jgi:hypothetical protein